MMSQIQTKKSCVVATRAASRTKMAEHNVTQQATAAAASTPSHSKTKQHRKARRSEGRKSIYTPEKERGRPMMVVEFKYNSLYDA